MTGLSKLKEISQMSSLYICGDCLAEFNEQFPECPACGSIYGLGYKGNTDKLRTALLAAIRVIEVYEGHLINIENNRAFDYNDMIVIAASALADGKAIMEGVE
jgi:hypothetical protein